MAGGRRSALAYGSPAQHIPRMKRLLTLGHGYTAQRLAGLALTAGWQVSGTTRNAACAAEIAATGVAPVLWGQAVLPLISRASHILISTAPDDKGDPALQAFTSALQAARPVWVGYLSTTAVYGNHDGAWVDEDTPLTPGTARGRARVAAETAWQSLGLPLHIFRLAGIYGPGRGPFEKVRDGTARRILKAGQVFSRIHVDDIAGALMSSMARPAPGSTYNVCDNDPAPPQDVLSYAAALLGLPEPASAAFETADLTAMARSFYAENKRVRNHRMIRDLPYALLYPDYRSGLRALVDAAG
jgi:nucleoside-diphosphate-sugar epimerase